MKMNDDYPDGPTPPKSTTHDAKVGTYTVAGIFALLVAVVAWAFLANGSSTPPGPVKGTPTPCVSTICPTPPPTPCTSVLCRTPLPTPTLVRTPAPASTSVPTKAKPTPTAARTPVPISTVPLPVPSAKPTAPLPVPSVRATVPAPISTPKK